MEESDCSISLLSDTLKSALQAQQEGLLPALILIRIAIYQLLPSFSNRSSRQFLRAQEVRNSNIQDTKRWSQ
jgi:hypothetical protein